MMKPTIVDTDPTGLRLLTTGELCALIERTEMRNAVVAEVCRRLIRRPQKANYLTFRWLVPLNDKDQADAFDGLLACCWNATEKRIYPYGLFPGGYLEARPDIVRETRDAIKNALVDRLYRMASLGSREILETAFNAGFQTDVEVANAVRQEIRRHRKIRSFEDVLPCSDDHEDGQTLLEVVPDDPELRANPYNDAVELINSAQADIGKVLGERGWKALLEFSELEDNHCLPEREREREAQLTQVFEKVYNVEERQARTHKASFRRRFQVAVEAGHPVMARIAELLGWLWRTPRQKN